MARYINWSDVSARYKNIGTDYDATQINSNYVPFVESQIEGMLSQKYTVPFSNNNFVVKDLCIELLYIKVANLNVKDSESRMKALLSRIDRILDGKENLVDDLGAVINKDVGSSVAWSSESGYQPTFGHGDIFDAEIDPDQVTDEEDAK